MNVSESNHIQKIKTADELKTAVLDTVDTQSVTGIHTHLFSPPFGELLLWGIDEPAPKPVSYTHLTLPTNREV